MPIRFIRLFACLFLLLFASSAVYARDAAKVYSLLILDSQMGNPYDEVRTALIQALNGFGFREGKNLRVTLRVTGNDVVAGEQTLRDAMQKDRYDVIFVGGTVATISAKNVLLGNAKQPVIFGSPTDPVGIGVIKDFSSAPFANFTGVCYPVPPKARLKFIRQFLPGVKTLGLIYADMPQSHSYNKWLQDLLANDAEFKGLKIIFRPVPLITGEHGDKQMADAAIPLIKELDAQVDAFIKPNDQLGTRRLFAETVYKTASKPLIGITRDDVMGHWGSTAVIYPSHSSIGQQTARMIKEVFQGKNTAEIYPEWPKKYGFAVDLPKARQFKIAVPVELLQLAGENVVK